MSRIEIPLPILFAWMVLTLVLMGQGMRLAADRQSEREPVRVSSIETGAVNSVLAGTRELVFPKPGPGRLALYQVLPERELLRWVEEVDADSAMSLLIPLAGLGPGEYLLREAPLAVSAADQEMDRPHRAPPERVRFRILPP